MNFDLIPELVYFCADFASLFSSSSLIETLLLSMTVFMFSLNFDLGNSLFSSDSSMSESSLFLTLLECLDDSATENAISGCRGAAFFLVLITVNGRGFRGIVRCNLVNFGFYYICFTNLVDESGIDLQETLALKGR